MRRPGSLLCVAVATLIPTPAGAAADEVLELGREMFIAPFASTREVARENHVPMQGFSSRAGRDHLVAGDSVTILVTGTGTPNSQQWLISITAEAPHPGPLSEDSADVTLFTNTGQEIRFAQDPAQLAIRIWGPIQEAQADSKQQSPPPRVEEARDAVNEAFLRLGFAQACDAMMRLHQARTDQRIAPDNMFSVGIKPFPPSQLAAGTRLADAAGFSPEDERAIAGTVPALMEYFDIASRSPGIRSLVWDLLKRPSVWSVLRRMGKVDSGVKFHAKGVASVAADPWGLPATANVFKLPFTLELNDRPGLVCVLVATEPRPPLLVSAGILGLSVQPPQNDEKRLFLRVIAAHTAD